MLRQTEEDADKEILELKTKYEKLLRSEREANVRCAEKVNSISLRPLSFSNLGSRLFSWIRVLKIFHDIS